MKRYFWLRRPIAKFLLILLFALFIGIAIQIASANLVFAQSDTAVRSEILDLRRRVNSLENTLRSRPQPGVQTTRPTSPSAPSPPQVVDGRVVGRSDPLFERLANLTIELRERVAALEKRVKLLEQKNAS
jgi:BMFP domain-containing protein YqiC